MFDNALRLFKSFAEELDPQVLQRKFLLALLELQNVGRGSIWIKVGDRYRCIDAVGLESEAVLGVEIETDRPSIVGWVIENGRMTIADPRRDLRHYKEVEENMAVKSRRILCLPLFLRDSTVYGAVQVIDTHPEESRLKLDPDHLNQVQDLVNIGSIALANAVFYRDQLHEARTLRRTLDQIRSTPLILGQSPALMEILGRMQHYARTDYPVLITGESGTGKDLVAQQIHLDSRRRQRPFLAQNCSAIPETLLESELFGHTRGAFSGAETDKVGLFEAADGGTVFLDEIGDMPVSLQARLLRVVQSGEVKPLGRTRPKKVDVRILSATNRPIREAVAEGSFRQDLFYRLAVLPIHLPPLRERPEDIPLLFHHFMKREALRLGMAPRRLDAAAAERLTRYAWAGNIRELENLVRYLLVVANDETIGLDDLPHFFQADRPEPEPGPVAPARPEPVPDSPPVDIDFGALGWQAVERAYARYRLRQSGGNVSRAARAAGLNRSTFVSRLRRLGVRPAR